MKTIYSFILFLGVVIQSKSQDNVSYEPFYTEATYSSKAINKTLAVGATAGSPGVSNGAATYSIPIVSVPRPDGAVPSPSLSIEYNSMAGDGLLGRGWNLSGVTSVIARSQKTIAYDGVTEPSCTAADVFTLDGKKLKLDVASSTSSYQVWHMEIEDYSLIKSFKNASGQIDRWEITTKDGLVMIYGEQTDSKVLATNSSGFNWNYSCDLANGAYILFYLDKVIFPSGKERYYEYTTFQDHTKAIQIITDDYGYTVFI